MLDPEQLKQDLRMLHREHGMSMAMLQSLAESPDQARKSMNFFKGMTFALNGTLAVFALFLLNYGVKHFMPIKIKPTLFLVSGVSLLFMVTRIYISNVLALKATEQIAKKHNLL